MAIIEGWLPPTREHFDLVLFFWQFYPAFGLLQFITSWYGMGKTSVSSPLNIPGRIAWVTMEVPGFITLLYVMNTLPEEHGITDLPWQNRVLGGLFVIHYIYRAILFPIIQPSMSPIHVVIWANAIIFQVINGGCIGSWLAAYGPTTNKEWDAQPAMLLRFAIGVALFYIGLTGNYFSDEELREIRRHEQKRQERLRGQGKKGIEKHYQIPQGGLFRYMLYPHYFMEWVEWTGFWIAGGWGFVPARCFLFNEIGAMFPRAIGGRKWYENRFGEDKIKKKWTVIPGVW